MNAKSSHHGGSQRLATIFLTNQCNLDCPYCYAIENTFLPGEEWTPSVIRPLLDHLGARGYRISIGGGEPLTRPALMLEVVREAVRRDMGVSLLTNGYLLDEALLKEIHKAGINWVQISADSADEVEHFAPLLSAGKALGMRMAVGTVLMPQRLGEVRGMHRILQESGAVGWRILRYTPLNEGPMAAQAPTNQAWIEMLLEVEEALRPFKGPVQVRYEPGVVPLTWLKAQPIEDRLDVCGGRTARRLFLYPDGEAFACGLPRQKGIALGNFKSDWDEFQRALEEVPEENCRFPELSSQKSSYCRQVCRGGCLQMRGDRACDPRCEIDKNLVPVCCFEKLLLSPGERSIGTVTYPSALYQDVVGAI